MARRDEKLAFEVDQSGKIEDTAKVTVIAIANNLRGRTIRIGAAEKQKLIKTLRTREYPKKTFVYKIFATLIFLISRAENINALEIDKEYPGNESIIKDTLIYLYRATGKKMPEIHFLLIGKSSPAHKEALSVFQKNKQPEIIVKSEEIIEVLYRNKKSWRSHSR